MSPFTPPAEFEDEEPANLTPDSPGAEAAESESDGWWRRPCGGRDVMVLSLPLIISTASWTVMNFIDRMFLLWHSPLEMAAAMPAGLLHFTMLCFPLGLATYVNTFVSQYHGAGRPERIGVAVWSGVRIGIYCTPLFIATIPLAPYVFDFAGHSAEVQIYETLYYQALAFGAGATIISAALTAFFTGRGETRVVMVVDTLAAVINIVLDYVWIFGKLGFPELGIEGAAWATVISQWFKVVVYWLIMDRAQNRQRYGLHTGRRFNANLMRRLLRFGGPNGLQMLVEVASVTLFVFLVGRLGDEAMTATNLAFNVNSVAFMPMVGMGVAISTMVGQQLGRNRADLASRATWTSLQMSSVYVTVMALLYVAVPNLFLFGHSWGSDIEDFDKIREVTIVLLRFVAVFCLFDMVQIVFVSAIKGAGDTRFILITTCVTAPLPVLIGWAGVRWYEGELIWCWVVITAWIISLSVIYMARFLQVNWKTMRVIEDDALRNDSEPAEDEVLVG